MNKVTVKAKDMIKALGKLHPDAKLVVTQSDHLSNGNVGYAQLPKKYKIRIFDEGDDITVDEIVYSIGRCQ